MDLSLKKIPALVFVNSLLVKADLLIIGLCLALALSEADAIAQSKIVRLATAVGPENSGLLRELLPEFEKETGYQVEVYRRRSAEDIFDLARTGKADLVILHYGHSELESFVLEGLGLWPRTVFANQAALIGPPSDPAHLDGLMDAVEGFHRISQTKSSFLVNNLRSLRHLELILWEGAGRPEKGEWYIDLGLQGHEAIEAAAKKGAYTLWGLDPFLRFQQHHHLDLQALVFKDSLLQRMMISVVVNPKGVPEVNFEGARTLQHYLLAPATQARIRRFRYAGFDHAVWWPFAWHNEHSELLGGSGMK